MYEFFKKEYVYSTRIIFLKTFVCSLKILHYQVADGRWQQRQN